MIIESLGMLASDTARSRAYLQAMVRYDIFPSHIIVYSDKLDQLRLTADDYAYNGESEEYFNLNEPVLATISKMKGVTYELIEERDINSEKLLLAINKSPEKYFVYSGYGGSILKKPLFELGKKYIHVHAGTLPYYRGSTTVYYSYINEGIIGTSAIFLSEGIDEGEIICRRDFEMPKKPVDIDYIYEPWARAETLIDVMRELIKKQTLSTKSQKDFLGGAETYFIIHPLLKHIALLSMEKEWKIEDGVIYAKS